MNIAVAKNKDELARAAADFIVERAYAAIADRGLFTLAVSGGSTPRKMLELLSESDAVDWSKVHLFQVDERVAPDGHEDRNATMLDQTLMRPDSKSAGSLTKVFLMPVNSENPVAEYDTTLNSLCGSPPTIDLIQLGLGDDGHTASLVPGDPVCEVTDTDIALTSQYKGRVRLTMTRPILERGREQLWLIAGANKQDAMKLFCNGEKTIPANLFDHSTAIVMCDNAALPDGYPKK